jgi:hypothetical protein
VIEVGTSTWRPAILSCCSSTPGCTDTNVSLIPSCNGFAVPELLPSKEFEGEFLDPGVAAFTFG